ncbi:hypothetical protein Pelo_3133 [Pelomyxa schiedti]|nr:hypothetical protein Pelo_3133 [Pelomyxa schiedti]
MAAHTSDVEFAPTNNNNGNADDPQSDRNEIFFSNLSSSSMCLLPPSPPSAPPSPDSSSLNDPLLVSDPVDLQHSHFGVMSSSGHSAPKGGTGTETEMHNLSMGLAIGPGPGSQKAIGGVDQKQGEKDVLFPSSDVFSSPEVIAKAGTSTSEELFTLPSVPLFNPNVLEPSDVYISHLEKTLDAAQKRSALLAQEEESDAGGSILTGGSADPMEAEQGLINNIPTNSHRKGRSTCPCCILL